MQALKAYFWHTKTTHEVKVLLKIISQHFIKIYFITKLMQSYICRPDAQGDIMGI